MLRNAQKNGIKFIEIYYFHKSNIKYIKKLKKSFVLLKFIHIFIKKL